MKERGTSERIISDFGKHGINKNIYTIGTSKGCIRYTADSGV